MKMDKKAIFSIAIVLLFVGSMFAIMTTGTNRTKPGSDINSDLNVNFTPVNYTTQFDANVLEVFPQIIVAGMPVDYDQTTIENKLLELQGLKSKNISYRQAEDGNINVVITLNITAEKKEEIVSKIKELEIIKEPIELYQYALLSVPADVNFTNDSNQTIEYSFGATPIEGIVNIDTLKEDSIFVSCFATFTGQKLVSATGIEGYNNSSSPQMLVSSGDFNVIDYGAQIYLEAQTMLIYPKDKTEIEAEIKIDYNNTEITYNFTQNLIYTLTEDKNKEELKNALDNLKNEKLFSDYTLDEENLSLEVYLNEDINNTEYQNLKTQIKELSDATVIVSEPKTNISIIFNYENIDVTKINNLLKSRGFSELKYKTIANVDTSNLIIEGKKYNYEQSTTQAFVDYPEDLNKTTLTLQIQAYAQRDNILYLGLQK
ncbi:MAG TPA: hypothetical protein PLK55_02435 [archaeon]|jgi:hypothetical protein|nr:hypothetical protein [archaeon]